MTKMEILKVVVDLAEKESDRGWTRYSMMLYSSSAMVGILAFAANPQSNFPNILASTFGLSIAVVWLFVNRASRFYERRWHLDFDAIVNSDRTLSKWVRGRIEPRLHWPLGDKSGTFFFNMLPVAFLILWVSILLREIILAAQRQNSPRELTMENVLSGIVTGVATVAVIGIIAWLWRLLRERRVKQMADLMEVIIEHRNAGRHVVPEASEWVRRAKALEHEAEKRAGKVSKASGVLIHSLGEFPDFPVDSKVRDPDQRHYVSLLTAVISRMRDTLGRHDR